MSHIDLFIQIGTRRYIQKKNKNDFPFEISFCYEKNSMLVKSRHNNVESSLLIEDDGTQYIMHSEYSIYKKKCLKCKIQYPPIQYKSLEEDIEALIDIIDEYSQTLIKLYSADPEWSSPFELSDVKITDEKQHKRTVIFF